MDIYERLDYLMKAKNLTVYRLSKELGYAKPGTFYAIRSRKVKPSYDTLTAILTRYDDLNGDWLLRGIGDAFKEESATALIRSVESRQEIPASDGPPTRVLHERITFLEQQLRDRDEIIALLKQQIMLMKELAQRSAVGSLQ